MCSSDLSIGFSDGEGVSDRTMQDIRKADVNVNLLARAFLYLVPLNMRMTHQRYRSSDLLLLRVSLGRENRLLQLLTDLVRRHLKLVSEAHYGTLYPTSWEGPCP